MRSIADEPVIQTLAQSEAELREHVRNLRQDVASYRCVLVETIHALHQITRERDQLRGRLNQLVDELRELRREQRRRAA